MPELPEVEEVRRTLEPVVLGVVISGAEVLRGDFVTPMGARLGRLVGKRIARTFRHGKKLFCVAEDGQTLVIHLGMSGRVDCVRTEASKAAHTHVTFTLASGVDVRLRDPRRFGGLWYYETLEEAKERELKSMGPDALLLTAGDLAHWRTTRGRLKHRLLGQGDVAGLGNIYVDESLWVARLHPLQRVDRVTGAQIETLVKAVHAILEKSIGAGGTTLRDYRNVSDQPGRFARELMAYGRTGEACKRCAGKLKGVVVAGRTTVFAQIAKGADN